MIAAAFIATAAAWPGKKSPTPPPQLADTSTATDDLASAIHAMRSELSTLTSLVTAQAKRLEVEGDKEAKKVEETIATLEMNTEAGQRKLGEELGKEAADDAPRERAAAEEVAWL